MDLGSIISGTVSTVAGGALGALVRAAPEVLNFFDKKNERQHELDMLAKNIDLEKLRNDHSERELAVNADMQQVTQGISAITEAIKAQAQPTGVKWVDALNATVRPVLTYLIAGPYALGKMLVFLALVYVGFKTRGISADGVTAALAATYTLADMAIVSGILNFYFLGRVFDKRR